MKYFKNQKDTLVYAYDETNPDQAVLITKAINNGWQDITESWPPTPTKSQIISTYELAAQNQLDSIAQSWGYDSLLSASSYVNSTVAQYKADALALVAWRDAVWTSAYSIENAINAGTQDLPPTTTAFVALLPLPPARPSV